MNERLKAWCERRMIPLAGYERGGYYATNSGITRSLYIRDDESWWLMAGSGSELEGKATPEKVESLCPILGIRLHDCGPKERHDSLVQLACAALSAADGLDPTIALALADEIQSRFVYPDITPEWLAEIGWGERNGNGIWTHQMWELRPIDLFETTETGNVRRWCWAMGEPGEKTSFYSGSLSHRGDLLKLMELSGHDWKNPPSVSYLCLIG